jgi:hypothetical protein
MRLIDHKLLVMRSRRRVCAVIPAFVIQGGFLLTWLQTAF